MKPSPEGLQKEGGSHLHSPPHPTPSQGLTCRRTVGGGRGACEKRSGKLVLTDAHLGGRGQTRGRGGILGSLPPSLEPSSNT